MVAMASTWPAVIFLLLLLAVQTTAALSTLLAP
jgi:hypothetical protein